MRLFGTIVLILFLQVFSQGCNLSPYRYCEIAIGKKALFVEKSDAFSAQHPDGTRLHKKNKVKCVEESAPEISELRMSVFLRTESRQFSVFASLLKDKHVCEYSARGPPAA